MMNFRSLQVEMAGAVAIVTLSRPERRNAIDESTVEEIGRLFQSPPSGLGFSPPGVIAMKRRSSTGRVPNRRARPTIDGIMKRLSTTPVLRTNVRAPSDQLLYNAGLFCRRTHMQCGIALGDVVLDPIEKILRCSLSRCPTSSVLFCEVRRSIKQPDGRRNVTRNDDFHERSEGIDLFVNGFHFSLLSSKQIIL
jgi:hypothetical protein